jgi:hypothetical protein
MGTGEFLLVILDEQPAVEPRELAGPLARALGRVRYDVLNAMKVNPHVPFADLSADEASAAAECLSAAGVRCAAVPAERLPPLGRAFTVHRAAPGEEGLEVQTDLAGARQVLPWGGIEAVSAATVIETSTAMGLDGGAIRAAVDTARTVPRMVRAGAVVGIVPSHSRSMIPDPQPVSKTDTYAVLCVMPAGADGEVRMRADQLNYDYLGPRLSTKGAENFRALAADVVSRAGSATVHGWARRLAETGASPPVLDRHMLARLNQWLRLLAREGS